MLLNDLYTIHYLTKVEHKIESVIQLTASHAIFKGHFPGQPVLPGVCMMQIITEIAGKILNRSFIISSAPMIKFLRMIDPLNTPLIHIEIEYQSADEITVIGGKIFLGVDTFMKFQMNLLDESYIEDNSHL